MDMTPMSLPNYSYVFPFEAEFDGTIKKEWMQHNWKTCFYYIGIYMILVFGGQHYMQFRSRFELRFILTIWNFFLALFSVLGTMRTMPELLFVIRKFGFHHSVCNGGASFVENNNVNGFWVWLFTLSKVPELGDTVFIVLRKQPLIFLHWYHHVTVLVYTWYSYPDHIATARWFVSMNYMVHAMMYAYYAFKSLKYRIPKHISMMITIAQLSQMVMGCYINIWAYQMKQNDIQCHVSYDNINASLVMYFSYFVLFGHYFNKAYLSNKKPSTKDDKLTKPMKGD